MTRVVLLLPILAACQQDLSLKAIPNDPPTAWIASHEDGDTVSEAVLESIRGAVDDDDDVTALDVRWFVDDDEVCSVPPNEEGDTVCDFIPPDVPTIRVRLEVRDDEGELASDQIDLTVEQTFPPTIDIRSPAADGRHYRNVPVALVAEAFDNEDPNDALVVSWTSSADGVLDADAVPDAAELATSEAMLTEGAHTLTAAVVDTTGKTAEDTVDIVVGGDNHPPECGILVPEDGSIQTYDVDIPFLGTATDPDVDPTLLTVTVTSDVDGVLVEGAPDAEGGIDTTIRLSRGMHTIELLVVDDAGWTCTDAVTVDASNSAPTAPEVEISPDPPTALSNLVCAVTAPSTDAEGDPITYGFTWLRDGVDVSGEATTTDLPGDTISWELTAPGQIWRCEVRGNDGLADGWPGWDEVEVVPPVATKVVAGVTHACQLDTASVLTCWGGDTFGALRLGGGRYRDVAVGVNHTCAITPGGTVTCVGWEADGRVDTSHLVGVFESIAGGDAHTCALDSLGEAWCWGNDSEGETIAPPGPFVEIAAGFRHTCARRADDSVECWGSDVYSRSTPPPGVDMVTISAGDQHSLGIDTSGTVHGWGRNNWGQLFPPAGSYVDVDAGERYSCGVKATGEAVCWGGETGPGETNEAPGHSDFLSISAGKSLSCGVREVGHVECWGENGEGQADAPEVWW